MHIQCPISRPLIHYRIRKKNRNCAEAIYIDGWTKLFLAAPLATTLSDWREWTTEVNALKFDRVGTRSAPKSSSHRTTRTKREQRRKVVTPLCLSLVGMQFPEVEILNRRTRERARLRSTEWNKEPGRNLSSSPQFRKIHSAERRRRVATVRKDSRAIVVATSGPLVGEGLPPATLPVGQLITITVPRNNINLKLGRWNFSVPAII